MIPWSQIERLANHHSLDGFTCGDTEMDKWIHGSARNANARNSCAVSVCLSEEREVAAFFGLVGHEIRTAGMPKKLGGTDPEMPEKDRAHPATLIGRLGLHMDHRRKGLGVELMLETLRAIVGAADVVGSRFVVLDAKNERLAQWYEERSFLRFPEQPLRLGMKMSTARALVDAAASS